MEHSFEAELLKSDRGVVYFIVPFSPNEVFGKAVRYFVTGTLNGTAFSGSLGARDGEYRFPVNKELQAAADIQASNRIKVTLQAAPPQEEGLPEDLTKALAQSPEAAKFFDALSSFYKNTYVKWITSAKKEDTRAQRVAEVLGLLKEGKKQR